MADKEYKTTIKIDGDSKGAKGAIDQVKSNLQNGLIGALGKVRLAIASVSRALGVFWLAWNGVQLVISGWQKLTEVMTSTQRKLEQNYFARFYNDAANAADKLIGRQKQLNAEIEKQARFQALQRDVGEIKTSAQRDFEDSRREVERAALLAGTTDPRQRQVLQDRFAREDEARKTEELKLERKERIAQLRSEVALQKSLAEGAASHRQEIAEELKSQRDMLHILELQKKPNQERLEATRKRIADLEREQKAAIEAADAAREARDAAAWKLNAYESAPLFTGGAASSAMRMAAWSRMDQADRAAQTAFDDQLYDNEAEAAWRRNFAALDDNEKVTALASREKEARARMAAAQQELADEMSKDVKVRSEDRISRARATIEQSQGAALSAIEQREGLERAIEERAQAEAAQRADSLAATFAAPGGRLNAMGLGAGDGVVGRAVEDINGKMSTALDILRQTLEEMRNGNLTSSGVAQFGA